MQASHAHVVHLGSSRRPVRAAAGCRRSAAPVQRVQQRRRTRASAAASAAAAAASSPAAAAAQVDGRNIVLAIDSDAQGSYHALQFTLKHIIRPGDTLHLLHVIQSSNGLFSCGSQSLASTLPPEEGLQEQMASHARQYFEAHHVQLAAESGARVQLDLVQGMCNRSVSAMLCEKVDDLQAALVVLSRRRRSFIEDLFSGPPVTQQVAQDCARPTLILQDTTC